MPGQVKPCKYNKAELNTRQELSLSIYGIMCIVQHFAFAFKLDEIGETIWNCLWHFKWTTFNAQRKKLLIQIGNIKKLLKKLKCDEKIRLERNILINFLLYIHLYLCFIEFQCPRKMRNVFFMIYTLFKFCTFFPMSYFDVCELLSSE